MQAKVGRPGKVQRYCNNCKKPSAPKDGDWFYSAESANSQVFLCKACERSESGSLKRAVAVR